MDKLLNSYFTAVTVHINNNIDDNNNKKIEILHVNKLLS